MNIKVYKANDKVHTLSDQELEKIVQMVFFDQVSDKEIAIQSGISKPTLYKLKRTDRFQKAMEEYGEVAVREADSRIQAYVRDAVSRLISLVGSHNEHIAIKASTEIIRLSGIREPLPKFTAERAVKSDQETVIKYLQLIAHDDGKQSDVSGN